MTTTLNLIDRKSLFVPVVAEGVKVLNEYFASSVDGPFDWRDKVSANGLSMMNAADCILGQVFGSYPRGMTVLFNLSDDYSEEVDLRIKAGVRHGFYSESCGTDGGWIECGSNDYNILLELWIEELGGLTDEYLEEELCHCGSYTCDYVN